MGATEREGEGGREGGRVGGRERETREREEGGREMKNLSYSSPIATLVQF